MFRIRGLFIVERITGINMKRDDFVFTIGYQGGIAIVDGQSKKKYGKLSLEELLNEKLFKAAFRYALFSENREEIEAVTAAYRGESGNTEVTTETLKRLFGVFSAPEEETKVKVI